MFNEESLIMEMMNNMAKARMNIRRLVENKSTIYIDDKEIVDGNHFTLQ